MAVVDAKKNLLFLKRHNSYHMHTAVLQLIGSGKFHIVKNKRTRTLEEYENLVEARPNSAPTTYTH